MKLDKRKVFTMKDLEKVRAVSSVSKSAGLKSQRSLVRFQDRPPMLLSEQVRHLTQKGDQ